MYNKIRDFAIRRCKYTFKVSTLLTTDLLVSNVQRNTVQRLQTESGLNYLTDTLTSAWDAMRANFGVSPQSAAPQGWLTRHRSQIQPLNHPLICPFFSPYSKPTPRPFRGLRRSTQRPYKKRRRKFVRKPPVRKAPVRVETPVLTPTPYRRKPEPSDWYSGDYEADWQSSHTYARSSEVTPPPRTYARSSEVIPPPRQPTDSREAAWPVRDIAFSDWSQRRQESEEQYQYYD